MQIFTKQVIPQLKSNTPTTNEIPEITDELTGFDLKSEESNHLKRKLHVIKRKGHDSSPPIALGKE